VVGGLTLYLSTEIQRGCFGVRIRQPSRQDRTHQYGCTACRSHFEISLPSSAPTLQWPPAYLDRTCQSPLPLISCLTCRSISVTIGYVVDYMSSKTLHATCQSSGG
jgi:hypothetical protein